MKSGYCTIMWDGRDRGASEVNDHQPQPRAGLYPKKVLLCMW